MQWRSQVYAMDLYNLGEDYEAYGVGRNVLSIRMPTAIQWSVYFNYPSH